MILTDKQYKSIFSKVPRACVDLLIGCNGKLVLVKRANEPFKGQWSFPGGRVRHGETLDKAIQRIATEEIGTRVIKNRLVDCMEFFDEIGFQHTVSFLFLVNVKNPSFNLDSQSSDVGLFSELPDNMQLQHREAYEKYCGL